MGENLSLKDFDILGIINLKEVQGIEKYTTPIRYNGKITEYLSRSKEYYNVKTLTELALEREELKAKLTREYSKRNFVILENMLNCSGRVYFKKFEEYIQSEKAENISIELKQAEECLMEDVRNIICILQKKGLIQVNKRTVLPIGSENAIKRPIEMDNKAMLYIFSKSLEMKRASEDVEVVTPGYGSIYIGPFIKSIYGCNFTNILKSKYIEETMSLQNITTSSLVSSDRILKNNKKILLIDDNIGTGVTMQEVKKTLEKEGIEQITSGAIQYNWRNYYRISVGEKSGINRFETNEFDLVSPLNYAGHKLYTHAIDILHSSGEKYIAYLNSKNYRIEGYSDLEGALDRGIEYAKRTGLDLLENEEESNKQESKEILEQYKDSPKEIIKPVSKRIIKTIVENVQNLDEETQSKENVKFDE